MKVEVEIITQTTHRWVTASTIINDIQQQFKVNITLPLGQGDICYVIYTSTTNNTFQEIWVGSHFVVFFFFVFFFWVFCSLISAISKFFNLAKVPLKSLESHLYLTGATAAELWWHLSNINVIFNSYHVFWQCWKILENSGMEEIGLVTPTLGFVLVDLSHGHQVCCTGNWGNHEYFWDLY